MKYIFEDGKQDALSKIFESAYSDSIINSFIYTNGCGNMERVLDSIDKEEEVYVYLDLVPDNVETAKIYRRIVKYRKKFKKFLIIPILCREYYYIKALSKTQAVQSGMDKAIEQCIRREYADENSIIQNERDRRFVKNQEKLCKLVAIKAFKECAKLSGEDIRFFKIGCICSDGSNCTETIEIRGKIELILKAYECIPAGANINGHIETSWEDCVRIHRELIDRYNEVVKLLEERNADKGVNKVYKMVSYMY